MALQDFRGCFKEAPRDQRQAEWNRGTSAKQPRKSRMPFLRSLRRGDMSYHIPDEIWEMSYFEWSQAKRSSYKQHFLQQNSVKQSQEDIQYEVESNWTSEIMTNCLYFVYSAKFCENNKEEKSKRVTQQLLEYPWEAPWKASWSPSKETLWLLKLRAG